MSHKSLIYKEFIMEWEDIDEYHKRARVINGWLVKATENVWVSLHEDVRPQQGYAWQVSICFVPDSEGAWVLT